MWDRVFGLSIVFVRAMKIRRARTRPQRECLLEDARQIRELAKSLPPGRERDALLRRAGEEEAVARLDAWLNSPGLQSPE